MAENQITDNVLLNPIIAFLLDAGVEIFEDDVNNWFILRDANPPNDPIEITPGIEARLPSKWPPV